MNGRGECGGDGDAGVGFGVGVVGGDDAQTTRQPSRETRHGSKRKGRARKEGD